MKILWVNQYFLHPTERGGQLRTLGILRQLHRWHEIHYAALEDPNSSEGRDMAPTFSTRAYPVPHPVVSRRSLAFVPQILHNVLASNLPLAVSRYASKELARTVSALEAKENYDCVVCDFVASGVNMPSVRHAVIFQHNVETTIFERHAEHAQTPLHRWFFQMQTRRMRGYEERMCRDCRHVIAVSEIDAQRMRDMFHIERVSDVPTGVDMEYFMRPADHTPRRDIHLAFVGSMDWLPNVDAVVWFAREILPLIRRHKPECRFAIVGRRPDQAVLDLAASDPGIEVTGTVPDVRPYLWNTRVSVLPLRIGGGTRMKVYEAMAACLPVVSTTVGVEGLVGENGRDLLVGDTPEVFAKHCLALLDDAELHARIGQAGFQQVQENCSWESVARQFEKILVNATHVPGGNQ